MRIFRLTLYFVLGLALSCVATFAAATTMIFNNDGKVVGSLARFPFYGTSGGLTYAPMDGGGMNINGTGNVNVPARTPVSVPVTLTQRVLAADAKALIVGMAKRNLPGLVATLAVSAAMSKLNLECDLTGCHTVLPASDPWLTYPATQGGTYWGPNAFAQGTYPSGQLLCDAAYQNMKNSYPQETGFVYISGSCFRASNTSSALFQAGTGRVGTFCPNGGTLSGTTCTQTACPAGSSHNSSGKCVSPQVYTDEMLGTEIQAQLTPQQTSDAVKSAVDSGYPVPSVATVSGPATVTSPSVSTVNTITNTDNSITTTTTTTSTTVNNTYTNNSYSYTTTENSVTKDAAGKVISTSSETTPESPAVVDSLMPDQPKLYERKYPKGLEGVWNDQSASMKAAPLYGLTSVFTPSVAAGSCPAWTFNSNIGPSMMFGSGSISPPCWIWGVIKAVVLVSALFLARSLIFGG